LHMERVVMGLVKIGIYHWRRHKRLLTVGIVIDKKWRSGNSRLKLSPYKRVIVRLLLEDWGISLGILLISKLLIVRQD
jgi:hypothetical protein